MSLPRPERGQGIPGLLKKFNHFSTLSVPFGLAGRRQGAGKALTLQGAPSIRPAMAAGAILPPLFFERRRHVSMFGLLTMASFRGGGNIRENIPASIKRLKSGAPSPTTLATGHRRRIFENMANTTSAKKGDAQDCPPHHHQQVAPHPDARRGSYRRRSDQERRPRCGAESDDARRTGTDAGRAAQHHSWQQCQPKGLAAHAPDRKARQIN